MNNVTQEIADFTRSKLKEAYGYCGEAIGENTTLFNSTDENEKLIVVTIEVREGE